MSTLVKTLTDKTQLTVGPGPHWRSGSGLSRSHFAQLFALIPVIIAGAIAHAVIRGTELEAASNTVNSLVSLLTFEVGLDTTALWLIGTASTVALGIGGGILAEYASQILMRQPYRATDGHAALMGLLLALLMPPTVSPLVLLVGVFTAIFIGKQLYGGLGGYPMHPVAVGWVVLVLSWPGELYVVGTSSIAAPHVAVVAITAIAGIGLCLARVIRWEIPVAMLAGVLLFSAILSPWLSDGIAAQFLTGHVVLGAFFLAPDPTTTPANRRAMWLFGLGMGLFVVLIRAFGIWPDAVPFALLLMNAVTPLLDRIRPAVRKVVLP